MKRFILNLLSPFYGLGFLLSLSVWANEPSTCLRTLDPTQIPAADQRNLTRMVKDLKASALVKSPAEAIALFKSERGTWIEVNDGEGQTRHLRTHVIRSNLKKSIGTYIFLGGLGYDEPRFRQAQDFIAANRAYDIIYLEIPGQGASRAIDIFNNRIEIKASESAEIIAKAIAKMGPLLDRESLFDGKNPVTLDLLSYAGWLSPLIYTELAKLLPPGAGLDRITLSAPGVQPLASLFLEDPANVVATLVGAWNNITRAQVNKVLSPINALGRMFFQPLFSFYGFNVPSLNYKTPLDSILLGKLESLFKNLIHGIEDDEDRISSYAQMTTGATHNSASVWANVNAKGTRANVVVSGSDYIMPTFLQYRVFESLVRATGGNARIFFLEEIIASEDQSAEDFIPGHDIQKDSTPAQLAALNRAIKSGTESTGTYVSISRNGEVKSLTHEELIQKINQQSQKWIDDNLPEYKTYLGDFLVKTPVIE